MITITLDEEKINFLMRLLHVIDDRMKPLVFSQKDIEGKHIFSLKEYDSYGEFIGKIRQSIPGRLPGNNENIVGQLHRNRDHRPSGGHRIHGKGMG